MLKRMYSKAKKFVNKISLAISAVAVTSLTATVAGAETPSLTSVSDEITTQFGEIVTTSLIVLGSVAGLAIILFGAIYAWRYGKKVFYIVTK